MFRKIKKLYFKIYHLFKLIGVFLVVFGIQKNVYALEYKECFDNYISELNIDVNDPSNYYYNNGNWIANGRNVWITQKKLYEFEGNNIYLTYFKDNYSYGDTKPDNTFCLAWIYTYDENKILLNSNNNSTYQFNGTLTDVEFSYNIENNIVNVIRKNENIKYISIVYNTRSCKYIPFEKNNLDFKFTVTPFSTLTCPTTPEPPTPEENNVYTSFLTIYFDRITYLAEGFTNNPYLIAMVGIIFGFVVLDLLLKIINIRRKK